MEKPAPTDYPIKEILTALEPARSGLGLAASWGREGTEARAYLETSHAVVRAWMRRVGGF